MHTIMDDGNKDKGKYEIERENYEYKDMINQVEKLISRIDDLYDEINKEGIVIPDRKKEKINNYIEKIRAEEINSLKLVSNHKEAIIKILEGLFKVSAFAQFRNDITEYLNERRERKQELALQKERERNERLMEKERLREERELEKQRAREEKEALILLREREKEERILQKEREKEERILQKERDREEKEALALQKEREKEEKAQLKEKDMEDFTMGGFSALPPEEEKEEVKEEEPALAAPSAAYYSPKEDTLAEEPVQKDTFDKEYGEYEDTNYLRYIIPIILILLIGLLLFLLWSNFDSIVDSMKFASDETEQIEQPAEVAGLTNCFPELTESADSIDFANTKLKNAYYCCFENRITKISPEIYAQWKRRNFELIKCITENLPNGYKLVVVGHANRTGYEEDMKVYLKDLNFPKLVVGNYTYSMNRARSLVDELNDSINEEVVLYYGVGSNKPRTSEGISPEDHLNRRITFKIMDDEESEKESKQWRYRKDDVKIVK